MSSEIAILTKRIEAVEKQNQAQNDKLDEGLDLMRRIHTAMAGDPTLGITGLAAAVKGAHDRIDLEVEARADFEQDTLKRMDTIEAAADKERWMGRIGSGVVGAVVAAVGLWLKGLFFSDK